VPDYCNLKLPMENKKGAHEIIEGLYLGGLDSATNIEFLEEKSIKFVLSILDEPDIPTIPLDTIKHKVIIAEDNKTQNLIQYFDEAHESIDNNLRDGNNVLVHCAEGVSRSATIIISYLMKKHNKTVNEAHALVKGARSKISPNIGFKKQLISYENFECVASVDAFKASQFISNDDVLSDFQQKT
jgi:protein tyrosine phosphatase